jgi:glycosyltransferase involved in cell wall biosynthesis
MRDQNEGGSRFKSQVKKGYTGKPLITIITATHNASRDLSSVIQSIRNQNYHNIEYIVLDGASNDGTIDILKANEDVIDYWVSEPDGGIYDAWNKGVKLSRGDWIAFLGADDIYLDGAIEGYVELINSYSDVSPEYVSSRVNLISKSKVLNVIGQPWKWKVFQRYMCVAHVGSFHHKSLFLKYGLFDPTYKICGDYELLLRAKDKLRAIYLNLTTVNMKVGGISNAKISVFNEFARAKISTGGQNYLQVQIEKYWAILKWFFKRSLGA